jgi:hypothetical protein
MKKAVISVVVSLFSTLTAQTANKPQLSHAPLTPEQIAVYRDFLASYNNGSGQPLNLSEATSTFQPDSGDYGGCMKDFPQVPGIFEIHMFPASLAQETHVRLVDHDKFELSDPEDAIRRGESVEKSVEAGFAGGLLTVSEILFDKRHHLAALHYSFVCGGLCGHTETIVLQRDHGRWKQTENSCGYGIS